MSQLHLLSPNEVSSTWIDLHLIELLAKRVLWEPQTTESVAKTIGYSSKPDGKAPLLNTTPIQHIEHGQVKLVPPYTLYPM